MSDTDISLRLILKEDDPVYKNFLEIKDNLGIKSNSEVLRFILKQVSKTSLTDLISKMKESIKIEH
jgi:hypothetical protein